MKENHKTVGHCTYIWSMKNVLAVKVKWHLKCNLIFLSNVDGKNSAENEHFNKTGLCGEWRCNSLWEICAWLIYEPIAFQFCHTKSERFEMFRTFQTVCNAHAHFIQHWIFLLGQCYDEYKHIAHTNNHEALKPFCDDVICIMSHREIW